MDRMPGMAPKVSALNDLEKGPMLSTADGTKEQLPAPGASEFPDDDGSKYVASPSASGGRKIEEEAALSPPLPVVKTNPEA